MEQFFTVHHELGHVQYFLQYQHLPSMYRDGANPGFHEAVGDVLSLSVSTPKHLEKIGLLKDYVEDEESKLNQFYGSALNKLVFLPFAYTLDKYRWGIFRGDIKPEQYNCKFWEMRSKFSGVEPCTIGWWWRTNVLEHMSDGKKLIVSVKSKVMCFSYVLMMCFIVIFSFFRVCIRVKKNCSGE